MAVVAQQRDAVGVALDTFDQGGGLRRAVLRGWSGPGEELRSFLEDIPSVRATEDQLIAHDAGAFPGHSQARLTCCGSVFRVGDRRLEVFNVNRTKIERSIGVDLLYYNQPFDAWTMVQYKCMENDGTREHPFYRPDAGFRKELARMDAFEASAKNHCGSNDVPVAFRLHNDGFFFKFCHRLVLDVMSEDLMPGMYLPRAYLKSTLAQDCTEGPRGGRLLTYESAGRHLTNTLFSALVRDGWLGTHGVSSTQVANLVRESLLADHSLVVARERPVKAGADMAATLRELDVAH